MMERPFVLLALGTSVALASVARHPGDPERHCYTQREDNGAIENAPYDGRFTFFRVRFEPSSGGGGGGFRGFRGDKKWDHDTPRAERHMMKIIREISTIQPQMDCGAIYAFGEAESFKYPIAYVSEPGFWTMSEEELKGVRDYVHKGGFLIFDDFGMQHWYNFEARWREAFPDLDIVNLDASHSVYDAFYKIPTLEGFTAPQQSTFGAIPAEFYGAFEDNDPKKRLVMVANYNNDLGDYMEWSDESFMPIALSNEAYKLMIDYVVYAMTH